MALNITLLEMSLQGTPEQQLEAVNGMSDSDMWQLAGDRQNRELYLRVERIRREDHARRGISMIRLAGAVACRIREDGAKVLGGRGELDGLSPEQVREKLMAERSERLKKGLR